MLDLLEDAVIATTIKPSGDETEVLSAGDENSAIVQQEFPQTFANLASSVLSSGSCCVRSLV